MTTEPNTAELTRAAEVFDASGRNYGYVERLNAIHFIADGLAANRVERGVLDELVTAAAAVLRAGPPPDYGSGPNDSDDRDFHLQHASAARRSRLRSALDAASQVTETLKEI